jgi:hypothetical protein
MDFFFLNISALEVLYLPRNNDDITISVEPIFLKCALKIDGIEERRSLRYSKEKVKVDKIEKKDYEAEI